MTIDFTAAQATFKERYEDKLQDSLPEETVLQQRVSFNTAKKEGKKYVQSVLVSQSGGWTFAGTSNRGTGFALNGSVSLKLDDANVTATEFVLQEDLSYGVLSSMTSKETNMGKPAMDLATYSMNKSMSLAQEIYLLYGQHHVGQVDAAASTDNGTTADLVITKATWSPGFWSAVPVGFKLDGHDGVASAKTNSNADIVVTGVDASTRTVSVSGNDTDITAFLADTTPVLVPLGTDGSTQEWGVGLRKILNTTGSTLFGIDQSAYGIFQANQVSAGNAALTYQTISNLMAPCYICGGGGKRLLLANPYTFADLNNDSMDFRQDARNKGGDFHIGSEGVIIHTPFGSVEVVPHSMVQAGEAYLLKTEDFSRVGSTDRTWKLPGGKDAFFHVNSTAASVQVRCYWDLTLFTSAPSGSGIITGIVNNSL